MQWGPYEVKRQRIEAEWHDWGSRCKGVPTLGGPILGGPILGGPHFHMTPGIPISQGPPWNRFYTRALGQRIMQTWVQCFASAGNQCFSYSKFWTLRSWYKDAVTSNRVILHLAMGDCTSKPESQQHSNFAATEPIQSVQSNIPGANGKSNLDSAKVKSKLDLPEQQRYLQGNSVNYASQ